MHVDIVPSSYAETLLPDHSPIELAVAHARGKAAGAAASSALIIGADTVVDLDGRVLGKPRDAVESRSMIERLSGRFHDVHTAFAIRDERTQQTLVGYETTRVHFAELRADTIDAYVASGDGLDKAGAYGIQGFAATLVDRIEGDYFTVVGFPLAAFARMLPAFGYRLDPPTAGAQSFSPRVPEVAR